MCISHSLQPAARTTSPVSKGTDSPNARKGSLSSSWIPRKIRPISSIILRLRFTLGPGWRYIELEFVSRTMGEILARVTPDQVGFSEDKAYKAHSMISLAMVEDFLVPAYNLWIPEITASGCQVIFMDSDGFIGERIPIWIDVGISVCGPIEVASGNDILAFRETLGIRWPIRVGSTNTRSLPGRVCARL